MRQLGVMQFTTREYVRKDAPDALADAQLPLAGATTRILFSRHGGDMAGKRVEVKLLAG
jgi:hypothetical protein